MAKWTKKTPNANYQVELEMNQVSQSISGNYSNVAWSFRIRKLAGSGYWNNNTSTWSASIGGNGYTGSGTYDFRGTSVKTLLSGTTRINHASNGTGSVTGSTWFSDNGGVIGNAGNTGHVLSLTTIPRASSIGTISGNQIGSQITVNISRASSSFTHQVWYALPGQSWQNLGTGHTTSCKFTIPLSQSSYRSSSTSGSVHIAIQTKNGSTNIGGEVRKYHTVYVPGSVVPSFSSLSVSEGNASVTSAIGNAYVQSKSRAKLTINGASGIYGSSIKSYRITGHGINTSGSSGTTSTITSSGNITYTATITDSRGRTASKTATINVLPYAPPRLSGLSYYRSNSGGTADPLGTYVTIKGEVTSSSLVVGGVQKNIVNYQSQTALGSSWVARTSQSYGKTSHSYSATFGGFGVDNAYNVRSRAGDIFNWGSWSAGVIPSGEVTQQWSRKTTSFGKMIDNKNYNIQAGFGGIHSDGDIIAKNIAFDLPYNPNGYSKIATLPADVGSGKGMASFLITGNSDYGYSLTNVDIVQLSTRGSGRLNVKRVAGHTGNSQGKYGWVKNAGGYAELWIKNVSYPYNINVKPLTLDGITQYGVLENRSSVPSGFIEASPEITADFVIENGSNSKGTWRKWNSGVMEVWGSSSVDVTTSIKMGSGYRTDFLKETYPTSFGNTTDMTGTLVADNLTAGSIQTLRAGDMTWTAMSLDSPNRGVTIIRYYIKGRWK